MFVISQQKPKQTLTCTKKPPTQQRLVANVISDTKQKFSMKSTSKSPTVMKTEHVGSGKMTPVFRETAADLATNHPKELGQAQEQLLAGIKKTVENRDAHLDIEKR